MIEKDGQEGIALTSLKARLTPNETQLNYPWIHQVSFLAFMQPMCQSRELLAANVWKLAKATLCGRVKNH